MKYILQNINSKTIQANFCPQKIAKQKLACLFCILLILSASCKKETNENVIKFTPLEINTPSGFDEMTIPDDNKLSLERVNLGKMLFFDPILSRDSSISCGTCHLQNIAFTDNLPVSRGIENRLGFRNTTGLTNVGFQPYFFKEGGVPTLERQVIAPIEDPVEMDFTLFDAIERLRNHPIYPQLILEAYGREVDAFSVTRAIAAFERTLVSFNSYYDRHNANNEANAMTQEQINGMNLFFGPKANCSQCHAGGNFTNYNFENNGLLQEYLDQGRFRITFDTSDIGKFKTPSLRNVEVTAPYMHNGSLNTLEEVVEHYNTGGTNHSNQNELVKPLNLSATEKNELVAFLKALTDREFLENESFMP